MKRITSISAILLVCLSLSAGNPASALKTKQQAKTLESIVRLDDNLYKVKYNADYKLPLALERGSRGNDELLRFVGTELLEPTAIPSAQGAGCSAFVCRTPDGDVLYCRNFDYDFKAPPVEMLCTISSKVSGANSSVSMAALNFIGYTAGQISDGKTDISKVVGAPYAPMDGMNSKGLAISVLQVSSFGAEQYDPSKPNASTSLMIRWILDRASTVDEALEMFSSVNFFAHGGKYRSNYHFFIADKTGRSVIVEYVQKTQGVPKEKVDEPYVMYVQETPYAANNFFYPDWDDPKAKHERDCVLKETLKAADGVLDYTRAWSLIGRVTREHTRWSVVYNLTRGTADIAWEKSGKIEHVKL